MGATSIWHILIVAIVAILLLGGGRFSAMMGDVAKGVKSFKKGMTEDDDAAKPAARLETVRPVDTTVDRDGARVRDDR